LFLPFNNLGLIIVDEEHESSYKQHDPAPRYHARDTALILAKIHAAKVLLGSATPSLESYFMAENGKYGLVKLDVRFYKSPLPELEFLDLIKERKRKKMSGPFSDKMIEALSNVIEKKNQAIIFQNRRGYAPYVMCQDCNWTPKCLNCSVSLVYHLYKDEIQCHYCGYKEKMPMVCNNCSSDQMIAISYGTEKLEEVLKEKFPDANVKRMDLDTLGSSVISRS